VLSLRNIEAGYGSLRVLHGLSFDVPTGHVVALLGGNGAGKTTTMRAITGLIPVQSGEILLDGEPLHKLPSHRIFACGVALVAQGRELFPEMTVRENLERGVLATTGRRDPGPRIAEMFRLFPRLQERADYRAGSLSGGEQQMVAMARALMSEPKVLLLDEPNTGLAPIIIDELARIIGELHRAGQTVLIVEQNTRMALKVSQHVYVIRHGEVVMSRPAAELSGDDEMFQAYMG
jgi:branched-chain amino acid transport system ATP-binding protein